MIVQAIVTKYIGPSSRRGSRVKATAAAGSVMLPWDDALNSETNHARAALALAAKFKWDGKYHCGGLPENWRGGNGYCFVNIGYVSEIPEFEVAGHMLFLRGVRQEG